MKKTLLLFLVMSFSNVFASTECKSEISYIYDSKQITSPGCAVSIYVWSREGELITAISHVDYNLSGMPCLIFADGLVRAYEMMYPDAVVKFELIG